MHRPTCEGNQHWGETYARSLRFELGHQTEIIVAYLMIGLAVVLAVIAFNGRRRGQNIGPGLWIGAVTLLAIGIGLKVLEQRKAAQAEADRPKYQAIQPRQF